MTASEGPTDEQQPQKQNRGKKQHQQHNSPSIRPRSTTEDATSERKTGTCKWFNVLKGFGFIVLDETNEDIFVHQSELKMEGFRSLEEGERVAFYVRARDNGQRAGSLEAFQVGPEDESKALIGSSIRPLGAKKDRLIRCYKCGKFGNHLAQRCRKVESDQKTCYGCGSTDHLFNTCPKVNHRKSSIRDGELHNKVQEAQ